MFLTPPRVWWCCAMAAIAVAPIAARPSGGGLPPNELGRIPILEYHGIDRPEARWSRTPEHFWHDLDQLWTRGYRLISLGDLLHDRIEVSAGFTPVVLTFDDSSPGQFRYLDDDGEAVIDPECAVGMLTRFAREHPGFGLAATFYVLPGANRPNRLFDQPALAARKLQYLATHGFEIGNHTLWHAQLDRYPEKVVRQQLALAQSWIDRDVPGYQLRTLSLPMGAYPRELQWAISGSANGAEYRHDAILMVAGGPAASPYARTFDPYHLPRIQATGSELDRLFADFERRSDRRFVSDGDARTITVPAGAADQIAPAFQARARVLDRR
jgi:peptidoglycan/xylan/chitin deacetylase (PgdA/CDA1 family)